MALSQHGTLAPVIIHHRTGFAASMIDGRTVMEIAGDARSADEIMQFWDYLARRLSRDLPHLAAERHRPCPCDRAQGAA